MRRIRIAVLGCALIAAAGLAQQPVPADCGSVELCTAELLAQPDGEARYPISLRLRAFGAPAAAALVALLESAGADVRDRAGLALAQFERIDPAHLPALVRAWRVGNVWMPRAIAATGTEEGLSLIAERMAADPSFGSGSQLSMALVRFGDRARPFLEAQLERCRASSDHERCGGVATVLAEFKPYPEWALGPLRAIVASPAASDRVKVAFQLGLDHFRDPLGLAVLQRQIETALARGPDADGFIASTIRTIGRQYGERGADAGPLIASFLARPDYPDSRAAAALALGQIRHAPAEAQLARLGSAYDDDWLLAYDAVEGLALLDAVGQRPLVERIARDHWHAAVRRNAERALNRLAGGRFERPGIAGDAQRSGETQDLALALSELRYAGDAPVQRWCEAARPAPERFDQAKLLALAPPSAGVRHFLPAEPGRAELAAYARAVPQRRPGAPSILHPHAGGWLVGSDHGEWGGELSFVGKGDPVTLAPGNAVALFAWGGRTWFASGLDHLLDRGTLWEIDLATLEPVRRIRLPASPRRFTVTSSGALVIATATGDVALSDQGVLLKPEEVGGCG